MIHNVKHRALGALITLVICVAGCTDTKLSSSRLGFLYVSQNGSTHKLMQICLDNLEAKELYASNHFDQIAIVDIPRVASNPRRILFNGQREGYMASLYLIEGTDTRSVLPSTHAGYTPQWSPDGKQFLFNGMTSADRTNPEIFLFDANGTIINVTNNPSSDFLPFWSPDGQSFVFTSTRDGNSEVYLGTFKDGTAINLTNNAAEDNASSWSPDGRWISFASERDSRRGLYGVDVHSAYAISRLDEGAVEDVLNYAWSPDSAQIAITYGDHSASQPAVLTLADKTTVPLTDFVGKTSGLPVWSPDGQQLLWMSNATGRFQIYLSDKDGGKRRQLTDDAGNAIYPAWTHCEG